MFFLARLSVGARRSNHLVNSVSVSWFWLMVVVTYIKLWFGYFFFRVVLFVSSPCFWIEPATRFVSQAGIFVKFLRKIGKFFIFLFFCFFFYKIRLIIRWWANYDWVTSAARCSRVRCVSCWLLACFWRNFYCMCVFLGHDCRSHACGRCSCRHCRSFCRLERSWFSKLNYQIYYYYFLILYYVTFVVVCV